MLVKLTTGVNFTNAFEHLFVQKFSKQVFCKFILGFYFLDSKIISVKSALKILVNLNPDQAKEFWLSEESNTFSLQLDHSGGSHPSRVPHGRVSRRQSSTDTSVHNICITNQTFGLVRKRFFSHKVIFKDEIYHSRNLINFHSTND